MQLYSHHFIANSTSYLNAAGFLEFFSAPVITQIESIGGGQAGGGWGEARTDGEVRTGGEPKAG